MLSSCRSLSKDPQSATLQRWVSLDSLPRISGPDNAILPMPTNDYGEILVILFTSGTTSLPKACQLSYENMTAAAVAHRQNRHIYKNDRLVQHLPSFHALGSIPQLAFWLAGAAVVYPSRSFDARASLRAIEDEKCTHMAAVPSMMSAMLGDDRLASSNLDSLRSIDIAGTIVPPGLIRKCMDKDNLGPSMFQQATE